MIVSTLMPLSSAWCVRCGHRYQAMPIGLCHQEVRAGGLIETCNGRILQFFARIPEQAGAS